MSILLLAAVAYFFSTSAAIEVWLGAALVRSVMPLGIFGMLAIYAFSPEAAYVTAWAGVLVLAARMAWELMA